MNYIDIVLAIFLLIAAFSGFRKGFIIEVASLFALILGIWGAIKFSHFMAGFLSGQFDFHANYLGVAAFVVTFLIIVIVVYALGRVFDGIVNAVALGFLNRLAGLVFGVLKGVLLLSVFLVVFDHVDKTAHILPEDQKKESKAYEPIRRVVPGVLPFLKFWEDEATETKRSSDEKA